VPERSLSEASVTLRRLGSLIGCARVSTAEQSADLQTDELTADGCLLSRADGAKDRSAAGARG